jgi:hypothetical protein
MHGHRAGRAGRSKHSVPKYPQKRRGVSMQKREKPTSSTSAKRPVLAKVGFATDQIAPNTCARQSPWPWPDMPPSMTVQSMTNCCGPWQPTSSRRAGLSGATRRKTRQSSPSFVTGFTQDILRDIVRHGCCLSESVLLTGRIAHHIDFVTAEHWQMFAAICKRVVPPIN